MPLLMFDVICLLQKSWFRTHRDLSHGHRSSNNGKISLEATNTINLSNVASSWILNFSLRMLLIANAFGKACYREDDQNQAQYIWVQSVSIMKYFRRYYPRRQTQTSCEEINIGGIAGASLNLIVDSIKARQHTSSIRIQSGSNFIVSC